MKICHSVRPKPKHFKFAVKSEKQEILKVTKLCGIVRGLCDDPENANY